MVWNFKNVSCDDSLYSTLIQKAKFLGFQLHFNSENPAKTTFIFWFYRHHKYCTSIKDPSVLIHTRIMQTNLLKWILFVSTYTYYWWSLSIIALSIFTFSKVSFSDLLTSNILALLRQFWFLRTFKNHTFESARVDRHRH